MLLLVLVLVLVLVQVCRCYLRSLAWCQGARLQQQHSERAHTQHR
jgi:hypothetical protein